jgi:hypothetical protein
MFQLTFERYNMPYLVDGYLTESKLFDIFKSNNEITKIQRQFSIPNIRYRSDYYIEYNNIPIIVEFEGETHFRDIDVIERDHKKSDIILTQLNFGLVKIPYFIQLNSDTWNWFFHGMKFDIITDYSHGFIDKKAKLPASFCASGYHKFTHLLELVYKDCPIVFFEIYKSLINWCKLKSPNYVYVDTFFEIKLLDYLNNHCINSDIKQLIVWIIKNSTHFSIDDREKWLSVII